MKIKNNSASFKIRYDNVDYQILNGEMEINNDDFGMFVLAKAREWGFDVVKTENTKKEVVEPIVTIEPEEEKDEDPVDEAPVEKEETKEEAPKNKTKTKK